MSARTKSSHRRGSLKKFPLKSAMVLTHATKIQKNPRAHKNKIGTPPPLQTQNTPPPLKRGILWTWRFSCRKNAEIRGAHKIGTAISGPRIADKTFTDTRIFLKNINRVNVYENEMV